VKRVAAERRIILSDLSFRLQFFVGGWWCSAKVICPACRFGAFDGDDLRGIIFSPWLSFRPARLRRFPLCGAGVSTVPAGRFGAI